MGKSDFISQATIATSTPRTMPRISWLRHHNGVNAAFAVAQEYLRDEPGGTAVTAAFLDAFSPKLIDELLELKCPGSSTDPSLREKILRRVKQELGMFVPIRLSELYGPENVATLRDGRAASPRKIPPGFPSAGWVANYTPHKLIGRGLEHLNAEEATSDPTVPTLGLRGRVGFQGVYEEINREERNLAAILYALLQNRDNLARFLGLVRHPVTDCAVLDEHAVFFEFAMVRDLWSTQVSGDNDLARAVVLENLAPAPVYLENCSIEEFNTFWGASNPSRTTIQMPARWSVPSMSNTIADNDLLLRACIFKWAFNAKPDMVIRTSRNAAVCIEMKLESGVGVYPSSSRDKDVFEDRGLATVKQTEVQRYLMEDLLGFETTFVLLSASPSRSSGVHKGLTWSELMRTLDLTATPAFVRRTISAVLERSR